MTDGTHKFGTLRPMQDSDLAMVLAWRNRPEVRKNMFTQQVIDIEDHRKWWAKTKENPNCQYLIFEADSQPIGAVNFTEISTADKTAFWGFYTSPNAPLGTGKRLGLCALDFAFGSLRLGKLTGEVLASNTKSLSFHQKLGFRKQGLESKYKEIDGVSVDVYRFTLTAANWTKMRPMLTKSGLRDAP